MDKSKIEEMGIRTPHNDKDINPYATCPHVKFMHPENRWCEFLAAAYFWPKYHNGDLLQPQEYQGKNGWDYANQDSAYFGTLVNKAGYLERVKTPGSIGLGAYKVTPLGEKVMRYMIRLIVGTAIRICDKDLDPEVVEDYLDENSEREVVNFKAPACGLTLVDVEY